MTESRVGCRSAARALGHRPRPRWGVRGDHRRAAGAAPQPGGPSMAESQRVIAFDHLRMSDVEHVGGKNASLGEMISQLAGAGIRVPGGFATTAFAFREFLTHNELQARIAARLASFDVDDVAELARAGAEIRGWIVACAAAAGAGSGHRDRVRRARRRVRPARRSPSGRRRPPRICPTRRSPDSRKHFLISMAWKTYFTQ